MYEKYPWRGTHAHTRAHMRRRGGSGRLAGINGLHSRSGLPGYSQVDRFNGIFKWPACPYLHSTLRGPPTKFFSRKKYYDPPRVFYSGGHGSYRHFIKIVSRRKMVETIVRLTLKGLLVKQHTSLESRPNIFKYKYICVSFRRFL